MVGIWDGVPASPCSGVSDDVTPLLSSATTRRKRTRNSTASSRRRHRESAVVEFVGVSDGKNETSSSLLAQKLNTNAADERRKALLTQLRLIDKRKAMLQALTRSSPCTGDINEPVIEAATPEPLEGDNPNNMVLDVTSARSVGNPIDVQRFCQSPSPTPLSSPRISSTSARTRSSPSVSYADLPTRRTSRRATRPRTPNVLLNAMPGETVLRKLPVGVLKCKLYCFSKKVISLLIKNQSAAPFSAPVKELWKPEAIPRYFDVITRPMDLGTIKKNMDGVFYLNTQESDPLKMFNSNQFADDVRQVFRNALIYNKEGDVLHNCATDLLQEFEVMWRELPLQTSNPDNRRKRAALAGRVASSAKRTRVDPQPVKPRFSPKTSPKGKKNVKAPNAKGQFKISEEMTPRQMRRRLEYLRKCQVAVRSRMPLPKGASFYDRAALIYDVPLTEQEKNEIAKTVKKLPASKLNTFLGIVSDATNKTGDNDEEVELDIFSLDMKTLRNIQAFLDTAVVSFKSIRTSSIGEEFTCAEEFIGEMKALEEKLAASPKQPRVGKSNIKESTTTEPKSTFTANPDDSQQLYASSDEEESSDSESDSDSGSDSE